MSLIKNDLNKMKQSPVILNLTFNGSTNEQSNKFNFQSDTQFIKLGDFNVHYLKKGKGQPIMLIHGGGTWMYSWRNTIDSLAKKYTVFACDMPGHGYTTTNKELKYNLDDFANFIKMFLNYHHIEKVTLIGNSWGGGWALYFTELYSDRVNNLILIAASGLNVKDVFEWEILKYPIIGELVSRMVTKKVIRNAYKKVYVDQSYINDELIEQTFIAMKIKQNRKATYKIKRNCDWKLTEQKLKDITVPVKIIWGDKDKYLDVKYAKIFASKIPNTDLTIIEKCGHTPHEERAEETIKLINKFLLK